MMRPTAICALAVIVLVSSTGCGPSPYFQMGKSKQGAAALIDAKVFEEIDLALLLNPTGENCHAELEGRACCDERRRLECAFASFYEEQDEERLELRRNRVQDRLIAASNQRCADYKQHVRRFDSTNNIALGGLTTLSAGLGAILTHVGTVRALSGAAAITSGFRAEMNQTYFQEHTIQVLSSGFERRRAELREEMETKRKGDRTAIEHYTVESAVADALEYHDACSLIAGLEEVAHSQKRAADPGLEQIEAALERWEQILKKMEDLAGDGQSGSTNANLGNGIREQEDTLNGVSGTATTGPTPTPAVR